MLVPENLKNHCVSSIGDARPSANLKLKYLKARPGNGHPKGAFSSPPRATPLVSRSQKKEAESMGLRECFCSRGFCWGHLQDPRSSVLVELGMAATVSLFPNSHAANSSLAPRLPRHHHRAAASRSCCLCAMPWDICPGHALQAASSQPSPASKV